ncbi:hypothetical protein SLS59_002298 [Nothophoma quercina]|uniref:Uncharacterized protein n=1 Tax=Nothophoma quercina TaxID=749835 RepID=A0ABR3RSY4_9PLEO
MKITALAFSALVSLAASQNGNDPLILSNRTGLDPIVYDTFSTSHTAATEPARAGVLTLVPLTPSPVQSNTFVKPTTFIDCWRNGYPCGQNGGRRSQRLVKNFVHATAGVAPRVPPSECFSTRTELRLPEETDVPAETGEVSMGILPSPISLCGDKQYSAPPVEISEPIFSALPIATLTAPTTGGVAVPTEWWRGPNMSSDWLRSHPPIPTEFWRAPGEATFALPVSTSTPSTEGAAIPTEWWRPAQPVPTTSAEGVALPTDWWRGNMPSYTTDCERHYCHSVPATSKPTQDMSSFSAKYGTPPVVKPTGAPTPSSHFAILPEVTPRAVPIDFWRGPGESVIPDAPAPEDDRYAPVQRHSSFVVVSTDDCFRHYCPSGSTTIVPTIMSTVFKTGEPTIVTAGPVCTSFPAVPPNVSTLKA